MQETQVQFLGHKDPLEKGMATQSNIPAWRSPWAEEPGGLQTMGSQGLTFSLFFTWCERSVFEICSTEKQAGLNAAVGKVS